MSENWSPVVFSALPVIGPLDHPASACLLKGTNNSARLIGICLGVYAPGQRAPGVDCHSNIST